MPKLPSAILFDADGTLYNSERLNHQAHKVTARELHDFDFAWQLYDTHIREGSKAGHEVLSELGIKDFDADRYQAHKAKIYDKLGLSQLETLPGLEDFLTWCQKTGIKCLVVSASGLSYIEKCLAALNIRDYFETIVSAESIGDNRKPHPLPYLTGLELAGVAADQAIAVEDTNKGITSAKAAGLRCVGIRNDANEPADLSKADHIILNYDELKSYLLR